MGRRNLAFEWSIDDWGLDSRSTNWLLGRKSIRIGFFLLHVDIERNDVHDTPSDDITTQGDIFTASLSVACMRCCRLSCIAYQRLVDRGAEHFSSLLRFTTHDIVVSTREMMNGIDEA